MTEYRRTWQITDIDWNQVFRSYEACFDCEIDGAVDIRKPWYDKNKDTLGRRLGACTVYFHDNSIFGIEKFRDEILSELGITLGYAEVTG